jgi:hypothetical protein
VTELGLGCYYINMPEDFKLTREVEMPRPRSSGAAVVAVASLAMFTAVGASAFVVRVRMDHGAALVATSVPPVAVQSDPSDAGDVRAELLEAARRGDIEAALEWYTYLPPHSPAAVELAPIRNDLAARFRDDQLARVAADVERGDCQAVNDRLGRLRHLLPEADLPLTMDRCSPPAVRPARGTRVTVRFVGVPRAK